MTTEKHEAPGLNWVGSKRGFWRAAPRFRKAGYAIKAIRLPGTKDDGQDALRARLCREYQMEAERWYDALDKPKVSLGTWHHLIGKYRSDEFSPINDVKANTRENYLWLLTRWEEVLGEKKVRATDYQEIKRIERAMRENGRSDSYIHRMFTMLRTVASYGTVTDFEGAAKVSTILSGMRIKTAPARTAAPTRAQIMQIVEAADARGQFAYGTGILIQFELTLRAVDVFGQWLKDDGQSGGVVRDGQRWQDGLTWDMVEPECAGFSKVISKTAKSMPEPIRFDLTDLPELRARMRLLANAGRVGPVITSEATGLPYAKYSRAQAFRRIRDDLKLPKNLMMMDVRAGAVTEAKNRGADPSMLRDAAQHSNISTTSRYMRDRDAGVAKVVKLRRGE